MQVEMLALTLLTAKFVEAQPKPVYVPSCAVIGDFPIEMVNIEKMPGELIGSLNCSQDGRHVVYATKLAKPDAAGHTWKVVADGKVVGSYDGPLPVENVGEASVPGLPVQFSADGTHYAFLGTRKGKSVPVVDGKESRSFDALSEFHLSSDGKQVAFTIIKDGKRSLVLNGREKLSAQNLHHLLFSPDSKHIAYVLSNGPVEKAYLDDQPVERSTTGNQISQTVHGLVFSSDSAHFAFVCSAQEGDQVIQDGKKVGRYPALGCGLCFSSDCRHLAFFVRRGAKTSVVLDGAESRGYQEIYNRSIQFLQDGRLAYSYNDGVGWTAQIGNEALGGRRLIAITPDGNHRAFLVGNSEVQLEVDGKLWSEAPGRIGFHGFSGSWGRHFVFGDNSPTDTYAAIDGVLEPGVNQVVYSPDERHAFSFSRQARVARRLYGPGKLPVLEVLFRWGPCLSRGRCKRQPSRAPH
jgi:hypothetical protein